MSKTLKKHFIFLFLIFIFLTQKTSAQLNASTAEALLLNNKEKNKNTKILPPNNNKFFNFNSNYSEEISNYDVKLEINKDAKVIITENILYDFKSLKRHGIFREIPYKYKDKYGKEYKLRLKIISVTDENQNIYPYKISKENKSNFLIKIGDPNKYVSGKKIYVLKYSVEHAIMFFKNYDEFYWNAIGHNWRVNILKGKAIVILPEDVEKNQLKYDCFTGKYGEIQKNCQINFIDKRKIEFVLSKSLSPSTGMTIVLGFPKNIVNKNLKKEILWYIFDNWPLCLIPLVFFILFYRWWKYGRDPRDTKPIISQYEPPDNLRPGEIGVIVDQKADNKDISATLIDLGIRGYLRIKEIKKNEYQLIKLKEGLDLQNFEKELFNEIFGNSKTKLLSSLKYKFTEKLEKIKDLLYENVKEKGYFPKNPKQIRNKYSIIGSLLICFSISFGIFTESIIYFLGFLICGLIFLIFAPFMPHRSYKGVIAYKHILGFKDFLLVTEKERLKFHNTLTKNFKFFEKYLPYAMVLNVEKEWAKQFKEIYQQKSSFYESYDNKSFTSILFVSAINNLSIQTNNILSSTLNTNSGTSGTSGFSGGFSGGGRGGGGGGSW